MLVRNLHLDIGPGDFVCILGRNGVGKTLTLQSLAGLRPVLSGEIRLNGESLGSLPRRELAQRLGMLLQIQDDTFPITVIESALMGRHPHLGFWQWESDDDRLVASEALRVFGLSGMEQRMVMTLSGGERRRVALATLLAQDPDVWLLDEPTNHLDPHHQLDVLHKLSTLAAAGKSVVATLHDPVLAGRFAKQILMLHGDGEWEFGPVDELLNSQTLERLYQTPFSSFQSDGRSVLLPA